MRRFHLKDLKIILRRKVRGIYFLYLGILLTIPALFLLDMSGAYEYAMQTPFTHFRYPLDVDMVSVVRVVKQNGYPGLQPVNKYPFREVITNNHICDEVTDGKIFLLYAVKSAVDHFERRMAIRNAWGGERVLGKTIRTVFLLGTRYYQVNLQDKVLAENEKFGDLVQDDFSDEYFNNTFKMMMGFRWATTHCRSAKYILFVDDDFYISSQNLVQYLDHVRDDNLIAGFIWNKSFPMRHRVSKWYVSLAEYPFTHWPPYPTAGAYVISMKTAINFNIAFHYTKYMRFDDVFVGIVAWKLHIKPVHHNAFHFYKVDPLRKEYLNTVASHGYEDPDELVNVWEAHRELLKKVSRISNQAPRS
ncbi:beta-1,3-galactosyltransferase brn-like [Lineus longissimus]|uniref:beta-1,3-galactosyltransferase brn-like n=1 Tax=Lineus longissimus TaxID=88925 RepID=UPI002B4F1F40